MKGLRILVVEDEFLVALDLEAMLLEIGCVPVGPAPRLDEALGIARDGAIDGAILDMNLDGKPVYPVAEALIARAIPFVFATGYGEEHLDPAFRGYPRVSNPFDQAMLRTTMADAFAGR